MVCTEADVQIVKSKLFKTSRICVGFFFSSMNQQATNESETYTDTCVLHIIMYM